MKKREKILCLIMFLFIYFLVPKNVLAARETKKCGCSGTIDNVDGKPSVSGNLILERVTAEGEGNEHIKTYTYTMNINEWGSGSGMPRNFNRPSSGNNNSKFSIPSQGDISCPKYAILNLRGNKSGDTYSGSGTMYLYTERSLTEGDRKWYSSSVTDADKKCTGFCRYNEWAMLTCSSQGETVTDEDKNHDNSQVNGDVQSTVEQRTGADDGEEEKTKKAIDLKQKSIGESKDQSCSDILGDVNTSNTVAWLLQKILNYIRIFGILLVLVFSALEFSKVILSNDYEALKKAQHKTTYRVGGIVALLLLPLLVSFLLGLFISGNIDFSCGFR